MLNNLNKSEANIVIPHIKVKLIKIINFLENR